MAYQSGGDGKDRVMELLWWVRALAAPGLTCAQRQIRQALTSREGSSYYLKEENGGLARN